ncbi:ArsR/SmtB family transcription factor [Oceanibium sediminis]|uniref:ArsR/SmtB family transcription factor n=1 Tax=Oceanibium sediminis TaxID=2026339 RepID=UPI000DD2D161|nr:metalloregulator ArsR/SmtB family transcription factor [Oceanibium sediminis]
MKSVHQSIQPKPDAPAGPQRLNRKFDSDLAVNFLKASGHPGRLAILRYLSTGEKSVGMLETLMETRQAAVSQQLARLRQEGLVTNRRDGKTIYYRLTDSQVERFVQLLETVFRA